MSTFGDYLTRFAERAVLDALSEATATYWQRRAETFEWARPRPDDYAGQASEADLAARDQRLAEAAQACRRRARVEVIGHDIAA